VPGSHPWFIAGSRSIRADIVVFRRKRVDPVGEKARAQNSMKAAVNQIDRGGRLSSVRMGAGRPDASGHRAATRQAAAIAADGRMVERASVRTTSGGVHIWISLAGRSPSGALPR
jgi:hypothetical protein